jgi:hypothetical protein
MVETVGEAKRELRIARHEQQERAAAFWQNIVDQGRVLRQAVEREQLERKEQRPPQQQ